MRGARRTIVRLYDTWYTLNTLTLANNSSYTRSSQEWKVMKQRTVADTKERAVPSIKNVQHDCCLLGWLLCTLHPLTSQKSSAEACIPRATTTEKRSTKWIGRTHGWGPFCRRFSLSPSAGGLHWWCLFLQALSDSRMPNAPGTRHSAQTGWSIKTRNLKSR